VAKAISMAAAGDTISVDAGTYTEIATFNGISGQTGCHIVLKSTTGQTAVLQGVQLNSSNYIDVQNLELTHQDAITPDGYGVYISGTSHDDTVLDATSTTFATKGFTRRVPSVTTSLWTGTLSRGRKWRE
jgi:hypothetical protein